MKYPMTLEVFIYDRRISILVFIGTADRSVSGNCYNCYTKAERSEVAMSGFFLPENKSAATKSKKRPLRASQVSTRTGKQDKQATKKGKSRFSAKFCESHVARIGKSQTVHLRFTVVSPTASSPTSHSLFTNA